MNAFAYGLPLQTVQKQPFAGVFEETESLI